MSFIAADDVPEWRKRQAARLEDPRRRYDIATAERIAAENDLNTARAKWIKKLSDHELKAAVDAAMERSTKTNAECLAASEESLRILQTPIETAPRILSSSNANSRGEFALGIADDVSGFLVATFEREIGESRETTLWCVKIGAMKTDMAVTLSHANCTSDIPPKD